MFMNHLSCGVDNLITICKFFFFFLLPLFSSVTDFSFASKLLNLIASNVSIIKNHISLHNADSHVGSANPMVDLKMGWAGDWLRMSV